MNIVRYVHITPSEVRLDGRLLETASTGAALLSELYRAHMGDYPKFFKMDVLCKLGVVATELLVEGEEGRFEPREDRAVLLFSKSGPLINDIGYEKTTSPEDYFPSPSLFVYTLANIVTGEIAIRNKYKGDTTAFELPDFDAEAIACNVEAAFEDSVTSSAVCGWAECCGPDTFEALMMLVTREGDGFDSETIKKIR